MNITALSIKIREYILYKYYHTFGDDHFEDFTLCLSKQTLNVFFETHKVTFIYSNKNVCVEIGDLVHSSVILEPEVISCFGEIWKDVNTMSVKELCDRISLICNRI